MSPASQGKAKPRKRRQVVSAKIDSAKSAARESPVVAQPVDVEIARLDGLFATAGLVRSLRGEAGGVTRRMRLERERSRAREGSKARQESRTDPSDLFRPAPTPLVASNGVEWLRVPGWERTRWLWHGFSTRRGGLSRVYCADDATGELGELNLGFTAADSREAVAQNRRLLTEAITGSPETRLIPIRQIHSSVIQSSVTRLACSSDATSTQLCKGDGLITNIPGMLLAVQTADCIPVLVADRKKRVVAAFHAGWRGTVKRIVESGVGRMRLEYGSRPEDLIAAIGPGIGPCCYAVGEEVFSSFESQFHYFADLFCDAYDSDPVRMKYPMLFLTQRPPGHSPIGPGLHLDLIEANRRQLLAAGLSARSVKVVGGCTSCQRDLFFSHRASKGHTGRMMAVIGIRPKDSHP
jgi:polyphenol oxidase